MKKNREGLVEVAPYHLSYLVQRDATLRVKEQESYRDSLAEIEASKAFTELMFKVLKSKDEDVLLFWKKRLLKLEVLIEINAKLKADMIVLEHQYNTLYHEYSKQVDLNIKLKDDFTDNSKK